MTIFLLISGFCRGIGARPLIRFLSQGLIIHFLEDSFAHEICILTSMVVNSVVYLKK